MTLASLGATLEWRDDVSAQSWDGALAALGGHPLQSALWGDARRRTEGTKDRRWMALCNDEPVWLARIEERRVPGGWIGWVPRGPTGEMPEDSDLPAELGRTLHRDGMILLVGDRWADRPGPSGSRSSPRTIWIDLGQGRTAVWQNLDKQWRYGVGRARRLGVTVGSVRGADDVARFAELCKMVAETKGFVLPGSGALMRELLRSKGRDVEAQLFLARFQGNVCAGSFVIRCGRSLHCMWSATDRSSAQARAGEAVQWAAVEWALGQGCTRYDLEGIDPEGNPGTYAFKKKMGGAEVTLSGKRFYPTGAYGRLLAWLATKRD